jgi:hypothetical protein
MLVWMSSESSVFWASALANVQQPCKQFGDVQAKRYVNFRNYLRSEELLYTAYSQPADDKIKKPGSFEPTDSSVIPVP